MSYIESIFNHVKSKNKIYCLEASAATYAILPNIKKHVIDVLNNEVLYGKNSKFNIICFNSDVAKWCVSLVPSTNEHVLVVEEWLHHIQSIGTCNFIGAIVSALQEPLVSSICAVVTQEPDQGIDEILDLFAYIGRKTQVHIRLCLLGSEFNEEMQKAYDIYTQIAEETKGSFAIVRVNQAGELIISKSERNMLLTPESPTIIDFITRDMTTSSEVEEKRSTLLQVLPGVYKDEETGAAYPLCSYPYENRNYQPFDFWKRVTASESYLECMRNLHQTNVSNMKSNYASSLAAKIIIGRKVLARKYTDGQYYIGTIKKQIDKDLFKVVLGPYNAPRCDFIATDYQKTKLLDMIDLDDAWKRSIIPGDRVLAPDPSTSHDGSGPFRYITGTVLDGYSCRDYMPYVSIDKTTKNFSSHQTPEENTSTLIVEFTHPLNKTEKVSSDRAIFIPEPFFQRLCLEGAMPKSAREHLYKVVNYPEKSMPGYPTSHSKKFPHDYTFSNLTFLKGKSLQVDYIMPPYCLPIYPVVDVLEKEDQNKGFVSRNTWTAGTIKMPSELFNKDDMQIPDSIYTVKELAMKVTDQLEKYKHLTTMKSVPDKTFFRKGVIKKSPADNLVSRQPALVKDPSFTSHTTRGSSNILNDVASNRPGTKDVVVKHDLVKNYSIHDIYYDDVEKIRVGGQVTLDESTVVSSDTLEYVNYVDKLKVNGKFESILQPHYALPTSQGHLPATLKVNKIKEINDNNRLQQRRRQVEKRLEAEKEKICNEERNRDLIEEHRRATTSWRIDKENDRRNREDAMMEATQSMKREVMSDVERTVQPTPSCQIRPQTIEEIDRARIEFKKNIREGRDRKKESRDAEALKYIEKLEESKKSRCDARWWEAQQKMLKDYPEKA